MGRKTTDPEKLARQARRAELREKLGDLADYKIKDVSEINELYKDFIGIFLENGLEGELEKNWATASMITKTERRIIIGTDTAKRR